MSLEEFSTGDWIDRLARALPGLAEAQEPYLGEFWEWNPRVHVALGGRDGTATSIPIGRCAHPLPESAAQPRLRRSGALRAAVRGARPRAAHSDFASDAGAGRGSDHRQGQLLYADPQCRRVDLSDRSDRGRDGTGCGALGRPVPDGGGRTERVPRVGWGRGFGQRSGRAGCRMRRSAVLRPDRGRTDRRRGRSGGPPFQSGAGVRGRGAGGGARAVRGRVSRFPVGRRGGQDLSVEARIAPHGLRRSARAA